MSLFSSFERPVKIGGKTGAHGIKAVYSTQNGTSLANLADLLLPPPVANDIITKKSRFYFGYSFNQYLHQPDVTVDKGWGIFGAVSVTDGDPTPIDWSMLLGFGGNGFFKNRQRDKWGIGFFHTSISNELKRSAKVFSIIMNDENGFEAFYNAQLMSWLYGVHGIVNPLLTYCFYGSEVLLNYK